MLSDSQRQALLSSVSPGRLRALAADLDGEERWPGSPGLDRCCERLAESLRLAGASPALVQRFPIGPEHRHFGWTVERRPITETAELWLQLEDGRQALICRGVEEPACVMGAYRSTADDGDLFEVVDVGLGVRASDYRPGMRMAGRLALASGHHFQAVMLEALAVRRSEGLLCGPGAEADPARVVPHRLGDPSLFDDHRPFGFNLSRQQHDLLVGRLASEGSLRVRVRLRQTLDSGHLPLLSAELPGSDLADQQVLLLAELPAVGSSLAAACLREVLHGLASGVVAGLLPPLRRTLRLLISPTPAATVAWLDQHRSSLPQLRAALQLSLPSPGSARLLHLHRPPPIRPSFVADLLQDHLGWAGDPLAPFRSGQLSVEPRAYAPGSPVHPLAAPELGLAPIWLRGAGAAGEGRAAEPLGALHLLTAALGSAALDLCNLDEEDLPRLISGSHCKALQRLAGRAEGLRASVQRELREARATGAAGRHLLWLADSSLREGLRREQAVVKSCGEYLGGPGQQALRLAEASSDLQQIAEATLRGLHAEVASSLAPRSRVFLQRHPLSPLERRAQAVRLTRTLDGPLPLPALLREAAPADREWLAGKAALLGEQPVGEALLFWINGELSLLEVHDRLCLDYPQTDLRLIWRYLEALQGAGWVRLDEQPRTATLDGEGEP